MIATRKIRGFVDYALLYDDASPEFIQALADYRQLIKKKGSIEDLLKHVAAQLHKSGGISDMVEGVGYVQRKGFVEKDEKRRLLWSGIYVKESDPVMYYYEV